MERIRRIRCTDSRGAPTHVALVVRGERVYLYANGSLMSFGEEETRELLTYLGESYYWLLNGEYWDGPDPEARTSRRWPLVAIAVAIGGLSALLDALSGVAPW